MNKVVRIQFPFDVRQTANNEIEVQVTNGPVFLNPEALNRAYPWLNEDQVADLCEKLNSTAMDEAIKAGVRVQHVAIPANPPIKAKVAC